MVPAAYLNYLYFDEDHALIRGGYVVIGEGANTHQLMELTGLPVFDEVGYVMVYVSCEGTANYVDFDDLTVTHTESAIVQGDNFYPYGLSFGSYRRIGNQENKFLFNGLSEFDEMLGVHQTPNRWLDQALGRFWGIDAMADMLPSISPMAFGFNNPIFFNDPLGLMGIPGCDECSDDAVVLEGITVTATPIQSVDFTALLNSQNPIERSIGIAHKNNDRQFFRNISTNKTIHFSHGEFLNEKLRPNKTIDALGLMFAGGIGGAMLATVASPILIQQIGQQALEKSGRFAFGFGQDVGIQLAAGNGLQDVDFADATINGGVTAFAPAGLNPAQVSKVFFASEMVQAAIDFKISVGIQGAGFGKGTVDIAHDAVFGGLRGFGNFRMNQDGAQKAVITVINAATDFSTTLVESQTSKLIGNE